MMKHYKSPFGAMLIIALTALALWLPGGVYAQAAGGVDAPTAQAAPALPPATDVTVTVIPDRDEMTVGDPLTLTVEVTHPAGTQALLPELGESWGAFEVHSQSPVEVIDNGDGTLTTSMTVEATLFAPGDYQTPPLAVTIVDANGELSRAEAGPAAVTVASVLPQAPAGDGAEELRDIKSQASLPLPTDWLAIAAGALGLALVVGAGWWLFRWVGRRGRLDNRSPEEVALDQLGRIRALDYPAQGNFKAHYSLVTDCLREYLERQYDIPARDQTTRELKRALETTRMSGIYVQQFTDLFADSDLVKFAKFTPTVDAARDLLIQAEKLVRETADEVARQAEADRLAEKAQASNPAVPAANGA
jgi:hypothetical protein